MHSSTSASLYKIAHFHLLLSELFLHSSREPNTPDRAIIDSAARNFSIRYCSLRPIPPHHQMAHACLIACLSHSMRLENHRVALEVLRDKKQIKAIEM